MKTIKLLMIAMIVAAGWPAATLATIQDAIKEQVVEATDMVKIKVRMEGPYTADTPLQVVCYFKYSAEGVKRMAGAPVELDKHLGGVIASLRQRGEFVGNDLETILITPQPGSIRAKSLLLIGLGDEATLSLAKMERVGKEAVRTASRLGVDKVAFAPLIRDQGNSTFSTGDVARSVLRGALLANNTERRLQKEGLGKAFSLKEWIEEAGPAFFDETVNAARKAVQEADAAINGRPANPYASGKQ